MSYVYYFTLKMEAGDSSKKVANLYKTRRCRIQKKILLNYILMILLYLTNIVCSFMLTRLSHKP